MVDDKLRSGMEKNIYIIQQLFICYNKQQKLDDYNIFKEYSTLINKEEEGLTLRGLLDFEFEANPIPLEEVEPVSNQLLRDLKLELCHMDQFLRKLMKHLL